MSALSPCSELSQLSKSDDSGMISRSELLALSKKESDEMMSDLYRRINAVRALAIIKKKLVDIAEVVHWKETLEEYNANKQEKYKLSDEELKIIQEEFR